MKISSPRWPTCSLLSSAVGLNEPIEDTVAAVVGGAVAGHSIEGALIHLAIETAKHLAHTAKEVTQADERIRR
jgi:hypothetical protein